MNAKLSTMSAALEFVWKEIQSKHKTVRPCIFTIYTTQASKNGEYTRGYFLKDGWVLKPLNLTDTKTLEQADEIYINSAIIKEGARSILRTLLHEAAHSYNFANNIKDVSRQNRYHNKKFQETAKAFGLVTGFDKKLGVTTPEIERETFIIYHKSIERLEADLNAFQILHGAESKPAQPNRQIKATCECGTIIRASKTVLDSKTVFCVTCNQAFTYDGQDLDDDQENDV